MSTLHRQLWSLAAALALAGAAQAQSQSSGGMVSGGNPGPGFMGAGSGSAGTVDGGVQGGPRDTSPGESRRRITRGEARDSAGHLAGPRVGAGAPAVSGTGVQGVSPGAGAAPAVPNPEPGSDLPRR